MLLQHLGRHGLAVEPLLQVVERRHGLLAAHQKLAVEHAVEVDGLDDVGKGAGDVLAGAAIEPLHAVRGGDLHADAVPFPFGAEMRRDRARRVRRGRWGWPASAAGRRRRHCCWAWARPPAASRTAAGRAAERPCQISSTSIDRLAADIGDGLLGEPRRDADAQRAGQQLQERPAARRSRGRPASASGWPASGSCVARCRRVDDLAERRRRSGGRIGLPDQRQRLGEVADIVVGEVEQFRADLVLAEAAQQRGLGGGEVEPAGERGQRPAAVGIGRARADRSRSAAAWRCAPAGRTRRSRRSAKACTRSPSLLAAGQMQRLGVDARSSAHSAPAPPRGRA